MSTDPNSDAVAAMKRAAAQGAASEAQDGMVIGLGSGSTAEFFLHALAERVRQGLRVTGVPSSARTGTIAASLGIPLCQLDEANALDMSVDGADEVVLPSLDLVKGRGGALLHEKLVAAVSRRRVIIVDSSKLVPTLGSRAPLPVEVVCFGWVHTARRLTALGWQVERRLAPSDDSAAEDVAPFVTDSGNYVLDCHTGPLVDAPATARFVKSLVGVVDHGLFIGMTERVIVAGVDAVRSYDRQA
ncbi:MAG TPA: ribose-5-phosphate isomerase RpiA [Ktedonobacterales bacterium]|jgi:ribose 5-phosphate isomerase A|nr:ribose-5-phosphate isomerase RpiA [Ktedonobacterales bacterium]